MSDTKREGLEAVHALIESIDESGSEIDVVSFDVPSGEDFGLH